MIRIARAIAASLALSASAATAALAADGSALDRLRWQARVLVVLAGSPTDARLAEQRRILAARSAGLAERDLRVVEGVGRSPSTDDLRRRFGVGADEFRAILLGKDGEAKLSSGEPLGTGTLFETIDAMPMRQDEMRRDEMRRRTGRGTAK